MNRDPEIWPSGPELIDRTESFDGGASLQYAVQRPDRYSFFCASRVTRYAIARGAGLSYAAASFGEGTVTVDLSSFDRVLGFDDRTGIVEVEAGMRLGDLFQFLARRDYYLPVLPGHGAISVGGCVAADVHGKNPARDGTFIHQVQSIELFHPSHGRVDLSSAHDADLFRATCGGYGTTGLIISAKLRAKRLPGRAVDLRWYATRNVEDGAAQLRALAADSDFVFSWHDLTKRGSDFGRGYVSAGTIIDASNGSAAGEENWSAPNISGAWRGRLPISVFNPWSTKAVNAIHGFRRRKGQGRSRSSLAECTFPIHGSEIYFRLFGKKGFHELQAIVPHDRFDEYVAGIRSAISKHHIAVTLASAKLFTGPCDLLRFTGDGICFALNIRRDSRSMAFLADMDRLVISVGGRPNIIKDSRLPKAIVEATYPDFGRFRAILRGWDAARVFRSELSARLGL
jgi:decaprenylphospho-beta-D-ribofuranose 2-oxidase